MKKTSVPVALFVALWLCAGEPLPAEQSPAAHLQAQQAIDAGDAERAIALLAPWIKKNPKDAEAHLLRSTARLMLGQALAGREDLDRALELDPGLRQGWLNRAAIALAEADYDGALAAFAKAEQLAPEEADNALNIGTAHLLKGDLGSASQRFREYLEKSPGSAPSYYLVASNYAMVGLVEPALQALGYAIQIDERIRRRARVDPNFADVSRDQRFRQLLETDGYRPPPGSLQAVQRFEAGYTGPRSRLLDAVIRSLELVGEPFDPQVEAADRWALIWARGFRVKVAAEELVASRVELTAPPGSYRPDVWNWKTTELFRQITVQLFGMKDKTATGEEPE